CCIYSLAPTRDPTTVFRNSVKKSPMRTQEELHMTEELLADWLRERPKTKAIICDIDDTLCVQFDRPILAACRFLVQLNSSPQLRKCVSFMRFFRVNCGPDPEVTTLVQPSKCQGQQLLHRGAAMVPCHRLMQPPPHPLHRVALRRVRRQVMKHHP